MLVNNLSYNLSLDLGMGTAGEANMESIAKFPLVPFVVTIGVVAALTVVGNAFVCTAIYINPGLQRVTYLAICSLSFADFLAGAVAMPAYMLKKLDLTHGEVLVCDLFRFSYFLTGYASISSLCVISVERMLVIRSPLTYHTKVTRSRVMAALILAWLDCLLISSLPFFPWEGERSKECHYNATSWWSIMVIVKNVFVPFIIIASCQLFLWSVARRHLGKIAAESFSFQKRKATKERKANKTILIIIGLFVLFWFPSCFYYFLRQTCPRCFPASFTEVESIFNAVMKIMTFMSSCTNPLVYCLRAREFRNALWKIVSKLGLTKSHRLVQRTCCDPPNCKNRGPTARKSSVSMVATFAETERNQAKKPNANLDVVIIEGRT